MYNNQLKPAALGIGKIRIKNNHIIYFCVFLACLVPRYIDVFKIRIILNVSFYALLVFAVSIFSIKRVCIHKQIESSFFWIWLVFIALSIWKSENISQWGYYVYYILTAVLFQQILQLYCDNETNDYAIRAMTDALLLHLLMGLYEVTAHRYLFETGNVVDGLYGRVAIGMFHNLNDYATFVTTMIPFCFYRFFNSNKITGKIYSIFLLSLSLYLTIISESRGVIFAFIGIICVGLFLFAIRNRRNALLVMIGLILFIVAILKDMGGLSSAINLLFTNNAVDLSTSNDTARINLIKNGLHFLGETYGFGVGAGNLKSWLETKSIYPIGLLLYIHNWYIEILSTFGLIFFAIYIFFHIKVAYILGSLKYGRSPQKLCVFLSFICFSIVSISSSSNIYSEWVWMYLVLISNYAYMMENQTVEYKQ